jgi:two-component system, NtrC family, response regulator HydG
VKPEGSSGEFLGGVASAEGGAMKTIERVSLADVMRHADRPLRYASSADLQLGVRPTLEDLAHSLMFSPGDGRIWLNDQRMVLMHAASLGGLRRELIETLGLTQARALLTRLGYASGARDAELVRRKWPDSELATAFNAGPRLHCLEGVVKVTPVKFEFDVDRGSFFAEFLWHDSTEAAEHVSAYGIGSSPCCWMQVGYASGYASAFVGKLILYREIECVAMGTPHCRIIGRPGTEWSQSNDDLEYFSPPGLKRKSYSLPGIEANTPERRSSDVTVCKPLVGLSASFCAARHMLERVASTDATVLLMGESGVGKELFARTLHDISARSAGHFIAVNCAAIPETLIEAELFGVEKGAFTGAVATRAGRFERASGGTLLLDEIGCLSQVAQSKLLRVLQEGEVERVGGQRAIKVDVRVVAATNISLVKAVRAGDFRDDLFYRLNVFPIELPPLRERRDDIPLLMDHFLKLYCARHRRSITGFTRRAVEALFNYEFPGNIRELQNLIERGVISAESGPLDVAHMFRQGELPGTSSFSVGADGQLMGNSDSPEEGGATASAGDRSTSLGALALDVGITMHELEDQLCEAALTRANGNVSKAARSIGITRAQLDYRMAKQARKR